MFCTHFYKNTQIKIKYSHHRLQQTPLALGCRRNGYRRWIDGYSSHSVPGLMRPSLSAGPLGTIEATKVPKSKCPTVSSPTITMPARAQRHRSHNKPTASQNYFSWYLLCNAMNCEATISQVGATSSQALKIICALISSPRPNFGSFLRETHKTSLSVDDPSFGGVSTKQKSDRQTGDYFFYFDAG